MRWKSFSKAATSASSRTFAQIRSEGDYVMIAPLRGPLNPTAVDHATDTYDTMDWLVKNAPEATQGRHSAFLMTAFTL